MQITPNFWRSHSRLYCPEDNSTTDDTQSIPLFKNFSLRQPQCCRTPANSFWWTFAGPARKLIVKIMNWPTRQWFCRAKVHLSAKICLCVEWPRAAPGDVVAGCVLYRSRLLTRLQLAWYYASRDACSRRSIEKHSTGDSGGMAGQLCGATGSLAYQPLQQQTFHFARGELSALSARSCSYCEAVPSPGRAKTVWSVSARGGASRPAVPPPACARHLALRASAESAQAPALKQACGAGNCSKLSPKSSVRQIHSTIKDESLCLFNTFSWPLPISLPCTA